MPLWFVPNQQDTPLHEQMAVKTMVAMPTYNYESQEEYCVLFFAYKELEVSELKRDLTCPYL